MKVTLTSVALVAATILLLSLSSPVAVEGKQKGECTVCVILISLLSQRALELGTTPETVFKNFCDDAKNPVGKTICNLVNTFLVLEGISGVNAKDAPEVSCKNLKMCDDASCTLFKQWPPASLIERMEAASRARAEGVEIPSGGGDFEKDFAQLLVFLTKGMKDNIENVFDRHVPMKSDDLDGDFHSPNSSALRGYNWRGRDCNDNDASVYPGRGSDLSTVSDGNCNGIVGADEFGRSYEETLCKNTTKQGVVILGDSAAAHFRLPPFLLNGTTVFNDEDWNGVLHMLMNEADWPECSWSTAYESAENCPPSYVPGGIQSIYTRMRERNLCNHRDYQNLGVNGARVTSMAPPNGIITSFKRDQKQDSPALVFYALVGNDVCNGHPGTDHMTTVPEFKEAVLSALEYLDTQLPSGSHVVFLPLAEGELLFDTLKDDLHPIGVTYADFYDYLICIESTPCYGWMNSNATMRHLTTERATELSAVYPPIVQNGQYKNFDMAVLPADWTKEALNRFIAIGGRAQDFISPSDGFHPSQNANMIISAMVWEWLETNYPSFLGEVNPNNEKIKSVFGNQGGY